MRAANMLTGVTSLLSFSTLVQAVAIPQGTNYNMTTSSAVSGYKNVAYFVNWVCSLAGVYVGEVRLTTYAGYLWSRIQPSGPSW